MGEEVGEKGDVDVDGVGSCDGDSRGVWILDGAHSRDAARRVGGSRHRQRHLGNGMDGRRHQILSRNCNRR